MPRIISGPPINTQQGTAPHLALEITWTSGTLAYATKDVVISGVSYVGAILDCGRIKSQIKKSAAATVSSVGIKLSDTDGSVKLGLDNTVFEKAKARLSVWYEGTVYTEFIPLITGNISGPIFWNESERTCSFSIESFIEDQDAGFAPTLDDFSDLDPDASGIPWPMLFGAVAHSPCVKVHKRVQGSLLAPCKLYKNPPFLDDTLSHKRDLILDIPDVYSFVDDATWEQNVLYIDNLAAFPASSSGSPITINVGGVYFKGYADGTNPQKFTVTRANAPKFASTIHFGTRPSSPFSSNENVAWLDSDGISIANCGIYLTSSWYNYCTSQQGRECFFRVPFMDPSTHRNKILISGQAIIEVYPISKCGMLRDVESDIWAAKAAWGSPAGPDTTKTNYALIKATLLKAANDDTSWWHADSDTVVYPVTTDADLYIASLIQLSSITAVYGKRRIKLADNKTKTVFCPIPATYYTVQLVSSYPVAGQHASAIEFATPLADYKGMGWEDDVYVSGVSTVGPNACDIIKFIIENFTDLTVDSAAYSDARANTRDANFAIYDKRNAIAICEEIAWQSRCGLLFESGKVVIRFLATRPGSVLYTLDDDNIDLENGINLSFTPIREIVTKLIGTWTPDYKDSKESDHLKHSKTLQVEQVVRSIVPNGRRTFTATQYSIYTNNQDKFGTHTENHNVYIFNSKTPVDEVIKFWGYRESNCWRQATIRAFPDSLVFECFDLIAIGIADVGVFNFSGEFSAQVISTELDWKDMSVYLGIEIPIKAGTQTDDSSNYWPGNG